MPNKPKANRMTDAQQAAVWLINHPAEYGRRVGFDRLRDDLHGEWIKHMLWRERDQTLQAHRGSYKTTSLDVAMALNCLVHRDQNTIFLRKTDADVAEVMQAVQNILRRPLTQAMCQALTGKPLELYAATNKRITTSLYTRAGGAPQILGIGIGGSLTGKHADIIITDDIVNRLDRQSPAERTRTKLIYQELQNLCNPGGRFLNSGTPWHKEDAFSLMPAPEKWDCYQTGILSTEKLEDLRQKMSPSLFAANYELRHIASEGALFTITPPTVREQDKDEKHLLRDGIAHIDAAYGGEDYTALTLARKRAGKIYLFGKLWHGHVDTVLDQAITLAKQYACGPIWVESNGDKGYLAREIRRKGFEAFSYTEEQNKYIKISSFLRKWWGNIVLIEGTDPAYLAQILDYTDTAEHDDAPDSAACVCRVLDRR